MVEMGVFFKALGVAIVFIALVFGFIVWIIMVVRKKYPYLRYWFKYNVRKHKYNEDDVKGLMEDAQNNVSDADLMKVLLLEEKLSEAKANELIWIFKELKKKLQGGNVKNE